jgi:AcrR family transcriptional regulator
MRAIASAAGVSPGLLYRYFPSKLAVVLALYDDLSERYARTVRLPDGGWGERAASALQHSLRVLGPHRKVLVEVLPVLLGDAEHGLLSPRATGSRSRVQGVFVQAAVGGGGSEALGRLLYVVHLGVLLFWVLDRSEGQRATERLVQLVRRGGRAASVLRWVPGSQRVVEHLDGIVSEGLFPTSSPMPSGPQGHP